MEILREARCLEDVTEFLGNCPVFAESSPRVNRLLAEGMQLQGFEAGELILEQGSDSQGVYVIVSGEVSVVVRQEGEPPQELARLGTGQVFGEISLVTESPVTADVRALGPLRALHLELGAFTAIAEQHPQVGIALTYLTAERLGRESLDGLGGKTIGGYRIERCVGRGQMAVVYRATCPADGQTVALKMMSHRLLFEAGGIERFHREADVLMTLTHPGIARHRARFDAYGTCFLAMEYCDGEDLARLLRRVRRLPEREVRKLLGQLAHALLHLRERSVVHRDLKPSNVMCTLAGELKLTDFGLAHPRDQVSSFDAGLILGTPIYMPPAQILGEADTGMADLYAFACIGYELLVGRPPFEAQSLGELVASKEAFRLRSSEMSWRLWFHLRRLLDSSESRALASLARIARWSGPLSPEYRLPTSASLAASASPARPGFARPGLER